jgi:hypothetical protein
MALVHDRSPVDELARLQAIALAAAQARKWVVGHCAVPTRPRRTDRLRLGQREDRRMAVVPAGAEFARIRGHLFDALAQRRVQHGLRIAAAGVPLFEGAVMTTPFTLRPLTAHGASTPVSDASSASPLMSRSKSEVLTGSSLLGGHAMGVATAKGNAASPSRVRCSPAICRWPPAATLAVCPSRPGSAGGPWSTGEPSPVVQRTVLTYDGLKSSPDDGLRRELLGGELYVSPPASPVHQRVVTEILVALHEERPRTISSSPRT